MGVTKVAADEKRILDPLWYSNEYPDVAWSGLSPQEHFKRYGRALGRAGTDGRKITNVAAESRPKVSVICICYNQEQYIEKAVSSIQNQIADFDVEIIIIDDCSTDATPDIIRKLVKDDARVNYIARNKNVGSTRNFGDALALARGEYVAICEGDDYWIDDHKITRQVKFLDDNLDLSICFHPVIVDYGEDQSSQIYPEGSGPFDARNLAFGNFIQTNSVMYRWRWAEGEFAKIYSPDISPSDWFLHLQHAEVGGIGFINLPMAVYRKHNGGMWWNAGSILHRIRYGKGQILFFKELGKLFGGAFYEHCLRVRIELATDLVRHYFLTDNPLALKELIEADSDATYTALADLGYLKPDNHEKNNKNEWLNLIEIPTVSVIVLTYNHEDTIEQCLRTVLEQTGPLIIELIIADDRSKDKTCAVIDSVISDIGHRANIKFLKANNNMGMQKNLRRALDAATGQYIAFCEGDDYWISPLKLIKQTQLLQANKSLSMCFNWILLENQIEHTLVPHPGQEKLIGSILSQQDLFYDPVTANFSCCMYRSSSLACLDDRYYQTKDAADWLFNLFSSNNGRIGFIRELLSVYRIHSGGQWSKMLPASQKVAFTDAQKRALAIFGQKLTVNRYKVDIVDYAVPEIVTAWLDFPQAGEANVQRGHLAIGGWAISALNRPIKIHIESEEKTYLLELNQVRNDVINGLGLVDFDPTCGFCVSIPSFDEFSLSLNLQIDDQILRWKEIRFSADYAADELIYGEL